MDQQHIDYFIEILGTKYVLQDGASIEKYSRELRKKYLTDAQLVLMPRDAAEISNILKYANQHLIKIIPQGGNTGLVGAQVPKNGDEVIINVSRLKGEIEVNPLTQSLTCDVGHTLFEIQQAADDAGLFFPLSLASEGSCQIGGNIASNAGGTGVLKYGNTRDLVLGLEVVMANGEIWNGLSHLRKDNTGYDLKHLFIGSEGTLGIITKATLKLYPKPANIKTAFCAIQDPKAAVELLSLAQKLSNSQVETFEIIPQIGIDYVIKHGNGRAPIETQTPWYILLEVNGEQALFENILEQAFEAELILDAALAQSETQAKDFWHLRHMLSEVQGLEGGSIKHDISVAVADIPEFLDKAAVICQQVIPNCRPVPFGHIGDGNLHYNISQPVEMDKQAFLDQWYDLADEIHKLVMSLNGSISAEHGIGQLKVDDMKWIKSDAELQMMRMIKQSFDPNNILNPGKTIPLKD